MVGGRGVAARPGALWQAWLRQGSGEKGLARWGEERLRPEIGDNGAGTGVREGMSILQLSLLVLLREKSVTHQQKNICVQG